MRISDCSSDVCSSDLDLVVGADVAGREQPELERLIGFFVNVLPLRSRLDADATFASFLAQTQDNLLSALEHQDLPFDQIVEASGVDRKSVVSGRSWSVRLSSGGGRNVKKNKSK